MFVAEVIGSVTAVNKEEHLKGLKLLVVQNTEDSTGRGSMIAIDTAGAGIGDLVLVTIDGGAARQAAGTARASVNNAVIGILDEQIKEKIWRE